MSDIMNTIWDEPIDETFSMIEYNMLNESIISPMSPKMKKLKEIKNARPNEYDGPKEVKEFVDKYYDDIMKISKILEEEPNKIRRATITDAIGTWVSILGGWAVLTSYTVGTSSLIVGILGYTTLLGGILFAMASIFINWLRKYHDKKAIDDMYKIRTALRKVNSKKLPENEKRRIADCLRATEDMEVEADTRVKISEAVAKLNEASADKEEVLARRKKYAEDMAQAEKESREAWDAPFSWHKFEDIQKANQKKKKLADEHSKAEEERHNERIDTLKHPSKWKDEFKREHEANVRRREEKKAARATNENAANLDEGAAKTTLGAGLVLGAGAGIYDGIKRHRLEKIAREEKAMRWTNAKNRLRDSMNKDARQRERLRDAKREAEIAKYEKRKRDYDHDIEPESEHKLRDATDKLKSSANKAKNKIFNRNKQSVNEGVAKAAGLALAGYTGYKVGKGITSAITKKIADDKEMAEYEHERAFGKNYKKRYNESADSDILSKVW